MALRLLRCQCLRLRASQRAAAARNRALESQALPRQAGRNRPAVDPAAHPENQGPRGLKGRLVRAAGRRFRSSSLLLPPIVRVRPVPV